MAYLKDENPSSLWTLVRCDFCLAESLRWVRLKPKRAWKIQPHSSQHGKTKRVEVGMWKVCDEHNGKSR